MLHQYETEVTRSLLPNLERSFLTVRWNICNILSTKVLQKSHYFVQNVTKLSNYSFLKTNILEPVNFQTQKLIVSSTVAFNKKLSEVEKITISVVNIVPMDFFTFTFPLWCIRTWRTLCKTKRGVQMIVWK